MATYPEGHDSYLDPANLTFCSVCDLPIPASMTSEEICGDCWTGHVEDHDDEEAKQWARENAESARGPRLLTAGDR